MGAVPIGEVVPLGLIAIVTEGGTRTVLAAGDGARSADVVLGHVVAAHADAGCAVVERLHVGEALCAVDLGEQAVVGDAVGEQGFGLVEVGLAGAGRVLVAVDAR